MMKELTKKRLENKKTDDVKKKTYNIKIQKSKFPEYMFCVKINKQKLDQVGKYNK